MEYLYKKKNLKFGNYKEIKKESILSVREASRQKRLSCLRDINFKDSKENLNASNKLEEKKRGIPSRNEMLKKWKEEKAMKQKQPVKSAVKTGFGFKKQIATFQNRTDDSKSKAQNVSNITLKTGTQNTKLISKSSSQPTFMPQKSTVPVTKSTVPVTKLSVPVTKSVSTNIKPQITQRSVASKSVLTSKPSTQKSRLTALSSTTSALQGKTILKETKPNVQKVPNPTRIYSQPSKGVPPPTNLRSASKNASSLPKVSQKLPLAKSKLEKDIKSTNVLTNNKPSKLAFPKNINHPNNKLLNKRNQITKNNRPTDAEIKESKVKKVEDEEIFSCDISRIEPSLSRKSFAPDNFMFCPRSEWSFAFQVDISSPASFLKLKTNGVQRTSSPLKLDVKSPADELLTTKNEDHSLDSNLHDGTSFNEKAKISPGDNECQRSLTDDFNMKVDIPEKRIESDISVSDLTAGLRPKMPLKTTTDSTKGDLLEEVTDANGVLNDKPTLLVALDNGVGELQQELTGEKCELNVEPAMLAAFDYSTSEITSEDFSKTCATSLKETLKQDESLETVNCVTSEVLDDNKMINLEPVDVLSSYKPISNCVSQTLVQIESPSQKSTESCPGSYGSGSSKMSRRDQFYEKSTASEIDVKLVDIDSAGIKFSCKSIDNNASEHNGGPDLYVSSSSETPQQEKFCRTLKGATSKIVEGIKLVNFDSPDAKCTSKSIVNSASESNEEESVMPISNNTGLPYLCVASPSQDKPLDKIDCIIPSMSEDINEVKTSDAISSHSTSENGLNELIKIENHEKQCPITLSESLKSFSLATSLAERVSKKNSMGHRKSKMALRYALESINESIESKDTPCVTPMSVKKLIVEESFTPRRSPRLAEKLNRSGSFESILNVEKPEVMNTFDLDDIKTNVPDSFAEEVMRTPSVKEKSKKDNDFTPRRSQRLTEMLGRSSSFENLFDVRRPSIMGSPCKADLPLQDATGITYDFDNLVLEDSPKIVKSAKGRAAQISKKVSLLYTPPTRKSTLRQSIRGDLMSFSPS
ncbi:serine-rich adhesin for platelets [Parasteatoda tepidariorum]|uniref:serine-rich adhesin for platelets n=1 Tax=Parasteatoda tepidariorum TaxID=114398 RepID=UPI001C7196D6|nr:uncharacterized protein LOC107455875 [Parasteatoda tepidariorum]